MPKIKVVPTPVQARILKWMRDNQYLSLHYGYNGLIWNTSYHGQQELGLEKPRSSTIKKMLKEDWLIEENRRIKITDIGIDAIRDFEEQDFISVAKSGYNEEQVIVALQKRFSKPDWLFINPFYISTDGWGKGRYADGFALRIRSGDGHNKYLDRWAFEVKVDRSDFKREIEDPEKRGPAMDLVHYFAFVAPQGLILPSEVPDRCGLLEILKNGKVRAKIKPMRLESPKVVGWDFVAQIARYWIPG